MWILQHIIVAEPWCIYNKVSLTPSQHVQSVIHHFQHPPMLMFKNGSWWIDVEPFCAGFHSWRHTHYSSNLVRHGSFSQITNAVISLLIQTGSSVSDSADCHKAVKHSVTSVGTSNDEKWHTGAALVPESLPSLVCLNAAALPPLLHLK